MAKEKTKHEEGIVIVVRIRGLIKATAPVKNTFERLNMHRKYATTVLDLSKPSVHGMLNKVKHYVAYGPATEKMLAEIIKARGQPIPNTPETEKVKAAIEKDSGALAKDLLSGKSFKELGLKPFFRMQPPKKGINSKIHYPKGVLGNNKSDIDKLLKRML